MKLQLLDLTVEKSSSRLDVPAPPSLLIDTENSGEDSSVMMTHEMHKEAVSRQAMSLAYSPFQSLLTTAFMLYMSGNSIQIFSIMMTAMALVNPVKAIANTNQTFDRFSKEISSSRDSQNNSQNSQNKGSSNAKKGEAERDGVDMLLPKLVFVSLQILALGVAIYKTHTMGLLPVTSGDWTAFIPDKNYQETSTFPFSN